MTAAGEWLRCSCPTLRPGEACPAHPFDPSQYVRATPLCVVPACCPDDGPGDPPPSPGPSLVAGSIGRGLTDAQAAYRAELAALWPGVVEQLPDD